MVAFITFEVLFLYEVVGSMRAHVKPCDNFTTGLQFYSTELIKHYRSASVTVRLEGLLRKHTICTYLLLTRVLVHMWSRKNVSCYVWQ